MNASGNAAEQIVRMTLQGVEVAGKMSMDGAERLVKLKFSKTNLILYAFGLVPVIWLALSVAPYIDGGLVEIIKNLSVAFSNPFNISFCEDSVKTVLIFILAYLLNLED